MAIPRLERLLNLTAALLDTSVPLTAEQIRHRVDGYEKTGDAFGRQFERDKDALREMGVPITVRPAPETDPPVSGYLIVPTEYYLPDPGFTGDELAVLHLAGRMVGFDETGTSSGLWKLGGNPSSEGEASSQEQDAPITSLPGDPNLAVVFAAATSQGSVRFTYHGKERTVHRPALGFRRGHWYLVGWDTASQQPRTFRFDRIDGIVDPVDSPEPTATEVTVSRSSLGSLEPWTLGLEPVVRATVRFDATVAPTVLHEVGSSTVSARHPDGSVEITLDVTNRDGFLAWVLGHLDHALVLAPPEMVDLVVGRLRTLSEGVR